MEEMRRNNHEIKDFLHSQQIRSDHIDEKHELSDEDKAELFVEHAEHKIRLSTMAKFHFGTLQATAKYRRRQQFDTIWKERFDDVEIQYDGRDARNPRKRWFARILAFIRIGSTLEGAVVQSYTFSNHCRLYPNPVCDLPVYRFWAEKEHRKAFANDVPYLRIFSLGTILKRVHLVPDFSLYYGKRDAYAKNWKNQRFLLNEDYDFL
jgi:hypothetical protein